MGVVFSFRRCIPREGKLTGGGVTCKERGGAVACRGGDRQKVPLSSSGDGGGGVGADGCCVSKLKGVWAVSWQPGFFCGH